MEVSSTASKEWVCRLESKEIKNIVEAWVENVILAHNLCPFAHDVWNQKRYEIVVSKETDFKHRMDDVLSFLEKKQSNMENFDTALLVFPAVRENFIRFYNFHAMLDEELKARDMMKDFQIVTFHPEFRFEGEKKSARGNFVNRSPYPLLHVLKSEDVTAVIEKVGEEAGQEVAFRNKDFLEGLSDNDFEEKIKRFITPFWNKNDES